MASLRALMLASLTLAACHSDPANWTTHAPDCRTTLDDFCGSGTNLCPRTWDDAQDLGNWDCVTVTLSTCDNVMVASLLHVDTSLHYLYDPGTGDLDRIDGFAPGLGSICWAGSGPEATCDDPHAVTLTSCLP